MTPRLAIDPPLADFAGFAEWTVAERIRLYPAMVEKGFMAEPDAPRRIRTMQAIAAIWRAAAENGSVLWDGPPVRRDAIDMELQATIDGSAQRIERDPDNRLLLDRHDALIAMQWWHRRYRDGPLYMHAVALNVRADTIADAITAEVARREQEAA
jgi:hypothetical protein